MNLEIFQNSLTQEVPPSELPHALAALWWDAKGDWERAHQCAQEALNHDGDWVHAYLHRKEGDVANAQYWYERAGKNLSAEPLEREWEQIVRSLLISSQED